MNSIEKDDGYDRRSYLFDGVKDLETVLEGYHEYQKAMRIFDYTRMEDYEIDRQTFNDMAEWIGFIGCRLQTVSETLESICKSLKSIEENDKKRSWLETIDAKRTS